MKVVMIYDQIQAGAGTKDDKMVGLNITKEKVGPTVMMEKKIVAENIQVLATLYCGNGYFIENEQEVVRKLSAMVAKINPDVVICGPSFNYLEYSLMCAKVASEIESNGIPVVCAMSSENENTIAAYSKQISIVKCPKKGGVGLSQTLENIIDVAMAKNKNIEFDKNLIY